MTAYFSCTNSKRPINAKHHQRIVKGLTSKLSAAEQRSWNSDDFEDSRESDPFFRRTNFGHIN